MINLDIEERTKAINKLLVKYFPDIQREDIEVHDCLFYLRVITPNGVYNVDAVNGVRLIRVL